MDMLMLLAGIASVLLPAYGLHLLIEALKGSDPQATFSKR